jgi:hypothetical protein
MNPFLSSGPWWLGEKPVKRQKIPDLVCGQAVRALPGIRDAFSTLTGTGNPENHYFKTQRQWAFLIKPTP